MTGTLKIRPLGAQFAEDHDLIGKMDPYVVVQVGAQKHQTKTASGQGTTPTWSDELVFQVSNETHMTVTVMDDDVGKDDFLGVLELGLGQFSHGMPVNAAFSLTTKDGKKAIGQIRLQVDFDSANKGPVYIPGQPMPGQPGQPGFQPNNNQGSWGN